MSIEFQCSTCQHVLKVADEHAGKSARCPACNAVTPIPLQSENTEPPADNPLDLPLSSDNPFADPMVKTESNVFASNNPYSAPTAHSAATPLKSGEIIPTAVGFDDLFQHSWKLWRDNLGLLVGMTVVVVLASMAVGFVTSIVETIVHGGPDPNVVSVTSVAMDLLSHFVTVFFQIGQIRLTLKIARGQQAELNELFSGMDKLLPAYVASLLFTIGMLFSLVLLIIPGIFFALYFWMHMHLIADRRAGIMESFSMSASIGKLNLGTSFVLGLASFAIVVIGLLMCCVGLLVAVPLATMLSSVAYLKMSGQI